MVRDGIHPSCCMKELVKHSFLHHVTHYLSSQTAFMWFSILFLVIRVFGNQRVLSFILQLIQHLEKLEILLKMFPLKMKLKCLLQKLSCMPLQLSTDELRLDPWPSNGTLHRLLIKEEYIRWAFRTIFINVPTYM